MKEKKKNPLFVGILSIILGLLFPIVGLILGIIGLVLAFSYQMCIRDRAKWLFDHYPDVQAAKGIGYKELFPYFLSLIHI